jgi:hypothetical protein
MVDYECNECKQPQFDFVKNLHHDKLPVSVAGKGIGLPPPLYCKEPVLYRDIY